MVQFAPDAVASALDEVDGPPVIPQLVCALVTPELARKAGRALTDPAWYRDMLEAFRTSLRLAAVFTRLALGRDVPALGAPAVSLDALLHLLAANERFVAAHEAALLSGGATDALREEAAAAFARAFARDVTPAVVDEVRVRIEARVRSAQDRGDAATAATLAASLDWFDKPADENSFLRAVYAVSPAGLWDVDELEYPFAKRLLNGGATDPRALEQYESFLREGGQHARADRVRRFAESAAPVRTASSPAV